MCNLATLYKTLGNKFLLCGLVFICSLPVALFADEPSTQDEQQIKVQAMNEPYASIQAAPGTDVYIGPFTGESNQVLPPDSVFPEVAIFTVETNVDLNLTYKIDVLHNGGMGKLETQFAIKQSNVDPSSFGSSYLNDNGKFLLDVPCLFDAGTITAMQGQLAKEHKAYSVYYRLSTGATISSQPAGEYTGGVSLTVSANLANYP